MPRDANDDLDARVGPAEAVRESYESMPVMLMGLGGAEHRVLAVNSVFRAVVSRERMVGRTLREIFPEVVGQNLFEMTDRVYETGVAQVARGWRVQLEREPGSGRLDELYVDFTMAPRFGPDGAITGLNFFGIDATERVLEQRRARRETAEAVRRYEEAREVITALQRRLLPPGLPVLPSVRIAGSYLLADAEDAAGGDWFDAVPLAGGRVALVVGDVVGHGVAASAAMGQLRAVLQDRLDETGDPVAALAAADRMAARVAEARAATVCVVVLDAAAGALTFCSAGHEPPLVVTDDSARYLPPSGAGPLGTGATYTAANARLEPGEVVLLYTDGIIERPGRDPAAARAELARAASDTLAERGLRGTGLPAVDRVCTLSLELLVRQSGHTDDITLLAAQRVAAPEPLHLRMAAGVDAVPATRVATNRWLREHGAGERDVNALAHALGELVTNAVEHSHPDAAEGTVTVTAELGPDGCARVRVADDGHWRDRARPGDEDFRADHGLGLAVATRLVDELEVDRGEHGTTATARLRLSHPARLLIADEVDHGTVPRAAEERPELMLMLDQPEASGSRVAVHGALDVSNAGRFAHELDRLTLGGTHELTVDLTAVTLLASAAVAVLLRANASDGDGHRPLRLYAPAGSVADQVLTLVDLAHTTEDPDGGG
ncbi:SpoIIE family protein phosphatase [Amycolatopsis sp. NPDC051903]|uniref:SpoIIE family protein phosphatase n=1 Tax=Amycolatopsis sp. NPDC051903 TaxID=3363936 RepID=UPI0037ADAFF7